MAISATIIGQVDPSAASMALGTNPADAGAAIVLVTLSASTDYGATTGFLTTNVLTAVGGSKITGAVVIQAKIAAGTTLLGFGVHDLANAKIRFLTAITNQTTATDYTPANGDIFTLLVTWI